MPINPFEIVCEILGQPAAEMRNPVNAGYECPFINSVCIKRSQRLEGPYPVCSIYRQPSKKKGTGRVPVIVCPKRFYQANLVGDVVKHCWGYDPPSKLVFVHEIKMAGFGQVDMVVADLNEAGDGIDRFISVELQAVDITGTCEPAYSAITLGNELDKKPTYSFNYANVQKRYITQLTTKGFFHHHWGTKIVAVVQDLIYDYLKQSIRFNDAQLDESDILFMRYKLVAVEDGTGYQLQFAEVSGTTHSALMMSTLYKSPPSKADFCGRIIAQLKK